VVDPTAPPVRDPVVRKGKLGARPGIVGRLAGVGAPSEAERIVKEWLQDFGDIEIGDERLVVGTVADRLSEGGLELRQSRQCLPDVVPILFQYPRHRIELVQRRRQPLLVVVDHAGELFGQGRRVDK
jgi:hypothetical protein